MGRSIENCRGLRCWRALRWWARRWRS